MSSSPDTLILDVTTRSWYALQVIDPAAEAPNWQYSAVYPTNVDATASVAELPYNVWYAYSVFLNLTSPFRYRVVVMTQTTTAAVMRNTPEEVT